MTVDVDGRELGRREAISRKVAEMLRGEASAWLVTSKNMRDDGCGRRDSPFADKS